MKYGKGSFIVVPNKEILRGMKPHVQVLFMWLCHYANESGQCFPSKKKLSVDCGISQRQVFVSMDLLIEAGLVHSQKRKEKSGRNKTNIYTVMVGGRVQEVHKDSAGDAGGEGAGGADRTQSTDELNPPNSPSPSDGHMVNALIDAFQPLNSSFTRFYKLKGQREACSRLIKQHGLDYMLKVVSYLPTSNANPYAPTITTPDQLEMKLAQLIAWGQKEKAKKTIKSKKIFI